MTNEEREALIAQGWTPPEPIDPDLLEARYIAERINIGINCPQFAKRVVQGGEDRSEGVRCALAGIKKGHELAVAGNPATEANPGMAWIKHDGSDKSPVAPDVTVAVFYVGGNDRFLNAGVAQDWGWSPVTHYAIITLPEGVA